MANLRKLEDCLKDSYVKVGPYKVIFVLVKVQLHLLVVAKDLKGK